MNDEHGDHMAPPIMPAPPGVTGSDAADPHAEQTQMAQPTTAQPHPQGAPDLSNAYTTGTYAPGAVTPNQPPQKKNRGVLIGVGLAVVALVVVLGGIFALRGNSNVGASTFSLQSAANSASEAKTVDYDMTITGGGQDITVTGQMDVAAQLMSMKMDVPGQGEMDMIVDATSQKMYISGEIFGAVAPTKWVSLDMSIIPGAEDQFAGGMTKNPLEVTSVFEGAQNVTEIGKETINGVETMHYEVTVDTAEIEKVAPDALTQMGPSMADDLPDELTYHVYVTENNELARMTMDMDVSGTPVSSVINVKAIDKPDPITIPAENDVTDITEMVSGVMGAMDSATG